MQNDSEAQREKTLRRPKHEFDIEDVAYIKAEVLRRCQWTRDEAKTEVQKEPGLLLFTVPHPAGGRPLFCGREAHKRFDSVAGREIATKRNAADFDHHAVAEELQISFSAYFLTEPQRAVDQRNVAKMCSSAMREAEKLHLRMTHFIPCVVVSSNEPESFRIGPVRFVRSEKFFLDHQERFAEEKTRSIVEQLARVEQAIAAGKLRREQAADEASTKKFADYMFRKMEDFYRPLGWIAEVSVPSCHPNVSAQRAAVATQAALDALKLFFGEAHLGQYFRMGVVAGLPEDTATLTRRDPEGNFDVTVTEETRAAYGDTDWWTKLEASYERTLTIVGHMIEAYLRPEAPPDVVARWLDALNWYGQALSEAATTAKIVKYVAAWERLTITKKTDTIGHDVTSRVAALRTENRSVKSFKNGFSKASLVYTWRSDLMHGSRSPRDSGAHSIAWDAQQLSRYVIVRAANLFSRMVADGRARKSDLERS